MSKLDVDLELIRKYNVTGPRYTSYPPATRFSESVSWSRISEEIPAPNETERDLSLYFHIPFCESLCWYCGCNTVITTQKSQSQTYLNYIEREMSLMEPLINPARKVSQIHIGGGTPTFLSPDEIRRLGEMIRSRFNLASDLEGGVEIDPRRLTFEHVAALREAGFNRASIGVQDFDPKVQFAVHRIQTKEQTGNAVRWLRDLAFESINIDLIYGLPYQTPASFARTLDSVLELDPDRLAVFSYAHVPWLKPAQKILEQALPSAEEKMTILKQVIETLTAGGGYNYIGMDHFAKPVDELSLAQKNRTLCRNFQGYSTKGGSDIYSFGVSAISQSKNVYWQNTKELSGYYQKLDQGLHPCQRGYILDQDDIIRRETIMRLMCDFSLNFDAMSHQTGTGFTEYFERELKSLEELQDDGLVKFNQGGFDVTETGRLFIRNIAMCFDAHLPCETERRFSRTV